MLRRRHALRNSDHSHLSRSTVGKPGSQRMAYRQHIPRLWRGVHVHLANHAFPLPPKAGCRKPAGRPTTHLVRKTQRSKPAQIRVRESTHISLPPHAALTLFSPST